MTYKVEFRKEATTHLNDWRSSDKNIYVKCFDFVLAVISDPRSGIGKPERLKGYGEMEVYSRRINEKDRFIYLILEDEKVVEVISCKGHYSDH